MVMLNEQSIGLIVCCLTSLVTAAFAIAVRGVFYYAHRTDNQLIVNAAAKAEQWGSISGMHRFSHGKAHMKEFAVVALAFMQRLLKDRQSDYALIVLCAFANALSAMLIYFIATDYWGSFIGLLLFTIFMFSFWPHMIALWGGVVAVAQAVALVGIYCVQLAEASIGIGQILWYGMAGVMTALVVFSSASSRKYLPLMLAAFFWSLRSEVHSWHWSSVAPTIGIVIAMIIGLGAITIILNTRSRRLTEMVYASKAPEFLNRLIKNRQRSLDEYLVITDQVTAAVTKRICLVMAYCLVGVVCIPSPLFWLAHAVGFCAFCCTVFVFIFPNLKQALSGYYIYSQYGKPIWRSRFYIYKEFFASIGRPVADDMRGGGWLWVLKYMHLMVPVVLYLYVAGIVLWAVGLLKTFHMQDAFGGVAMILLSASPILMAELSRAVQVGRSYFPSLSGLLVLIGFTFHTALPWLGHDGEMFLWAASGILAAAGSVINIALFLNDVLPSRMSVNNLVQFLRKNSIKEFYTFDTRYNDVFVDCMPNAVKQDFNIHFIKSINEVKEGYVVVPPVNAKGLLMSDFIQARRSSNVFEDDPCLEEMIASNSIEHKACACFPSMSSSRFWVHEAEVPSYRNLILNEITSMDFYRGRAWVLKI